MTIANGAQHSLNYVAEVTYGTTPVDPTWLSCPHTGTTLAMSKDALESEKLRGDRQIEDFRHGNKSIGGDFSAELEYSSLDDILEATFCGTWTADVLKTGVTRRSFTFESKFGDLAVPEYHRYTGSEITSMSMSIAPNAMVTTSFTVVGQDLTLNTTELANSTYVPDGDFSPFDSFTGTISEGGVTIGVVTSLDLTLENGLEPLFAVGSPITIRPSIGKSRLTGTLTTYFENKTLYQKFINETASSISCTLIDPAGNSYQIDLGNVKYNSGQPDVTGEGAITIPMDFVGLYDTIDDSNIVITRTSV